MDFYRKKILILAKSKKYNNTCVAGVTIADLNSIERGKGEWIRPIDHDHNGAIADETMMLARKNNASPRQLQLLDIVSIPLTKKIHSDHQPENFHIKTDGTFDENKWNLESAPFKGNNSLSNERKLILDYMRSICLKTLHWPNDSSRNGVNDRVPFDKRFIINYSLALVETEVTVYFTKDRKPRGEFKLDEVEYDLAITDQRIEKWLTKNDFERVLLQKAFMCLSLGEFFQGYDGSRCSYKLISSLFTPY